MRRHSKEHWSSPSICSVPWPAAIRDAPTAASSKLRVACPVNQTRDNIPHADTGSPAEIARNDGEIMPVRSRPVVAGQSRIELTPGSSVVIVSVVTLGVKHFVWFESSPRRTSRRSCHHWQQRHTLGTMNASSVRLIECLLACS